MIYSNRFVSECNEYSTYEKNIPAPIFRKSFQLDKPADSAELLICGLGFYDLFLNGRKITKGYLAPYISNTDHYIYYDKYDIAPYLNIGENVIGVMLGDGHLVGKTLTWNFKDNQTNAAPMLALSTEIRCQEETIHFEADEFVCKKGPIIFNDLRSGVFYDARLEDSGWNDIGFVEKDWHKPVEAINKPRGKARICKAEPIKVYREIKPIGINKGELVPYKASRQVAAFHESLQTFESAVPHQGGYIYDFGENNSGIYRLKIKGRKGQKIDIQCGEQLVDENLCYNNINFYPDGFCQRDIYWLKGDEEEIFEPMFTFHGYRYLYICGITEQQATEDLLTYLVMSSDLEERGTFECSNARVNSLYQMGRRSDVSNFFYFPMDCPHREKNGWTADASLSAEHMIMTMGVEHSWREWLHNIRAAQREDGQLPGIIPTDHWGYDEGLNGPAWDCVLFNLPYMAYKYRGNTEIIKENAGAMLRYLELMAQKRDAEGIIAYGLGDWVPVGKPCDQYDADLGFTSSVMVFDMCQKAEMMFSAIGYELHKDFACKLKKEILQAIRDKYIDFVNFTVKDKSQTSQAMAIFYGIFEEHEKQAGFQALLSILRKDHYDFTCGCLGVRVLFHVLADFGEVSLAYELITRKTFPSYGYWLDKGETTFLETFSKYDKYYGSSKNHHFQGDIVNWFMRVIGGLNVQNSNFVKISPCFIDEIDWCRVSHSLPNGKMEIYWQRDQDKIILEINVDDGIEYTIASDLGKNVIINERNLEKCKLK